MKMPKRIHFLTTNKHPTLKHVQSQGISARFERIATFRLLGCYCFKEENRRTGKISERVPSITEPINHDEHVSILLDATSKQGPNPEGSRKCGAGKSEADRQRYGGRESRRHCRKYQKKKRVDGKRVDDNKRRRSEHGYALDEHR
ncbi:uncharacterized protein LOC122571610 isoform X2 [Bombus pyrosoma]|uniref:uncharacterized protein LOC122571610 isoform X2 n=1 Tax=Bombus pyrosoma TaxID=396416 RepID=UPI001CB96920|nr:uncharacterized protein LOC122571610 isoform X2 [Bombus pyrosoma]